MDANDNPKTGEHTGNVIFAATLRPYRSLGTAGYAVVMGFVGLTCFISGLMFYALGAWPIVGFLGLDVLLVWLAFKLNYRSGRARETVSLSRDRLVIRKVQPNGRASEMLFNPYWVRLEVSEADEEGVTRIEVHSRGEAVPVGTFLNPGDRTSFARAFRAALMEAKSPGL
ncbi:MAG TPA: DUF2244 domain-containing protein [Afifellaceae bacterium]|nr:DUF2244 domain-containing protein [Afifellaceae bacterium]